MPPTSYTRSKAVSLFMTATNASKDDAVKVGWNECKETRPSPKPQTGAAGAALHQAALAPEPVPSAPFDTSYRSDCHAPPLPRDAPVA